MTILLSLLALGASVASLVYSLWVDRQIRKLEENAASEMERHWRFIESLPRRPKREEND